MGFLRSKDENDIPPENERIDEENKNKSFYNSSTKFFKDTLTPSLKSSIKKELQQCKQQNSTGKYEIENIVFTSMYQERVYESTVNLTENGISETHGINTGVHFTTSKESENKVSMGIESIVSLNFERGQNSTLSTTTIEEKTTSRTYTISPRSKIIIEQLHVCGTITWRKKYQGLSSLRQSKVKRDVFDYKTDRTIHKNIAVDDDSAI